MTSQSEVGHAKNLANIKLLKDCIVQIGATYNPINLQLTVSSITTLVTSCQTAYSNWISKLTIYKDESNKREIAFEPLNKLVTAVNQSVQQLNEPQQTFDDIQAIVKKIHGDSSKIKKSNANKIINPNPIPVDPNNPIPPVDTDITIIDQISTSQQSYDSLITNFDKLIKRLQTITTYIPNETELQITTLQTLFTNLNTLNASAGGADFALSLARNQRNLIFYAPQTGMYDITKKIKKYIRSNKAISPAIYSEITKLRFVKIVQKKKKKKATN